MPYKKDKNLTYELKYNGINEIIDERNNTVMMLREVGWGGRPPRLELRKWIINSDGEIANKGVAFMTEDGPHNLVDTMTNLGFGRTKNILNNIKNRDDFEDSLVQVIGKEKVNTAKKTEFVRDDNDESYYDPRRLIISNDNVNNDDEE